MPVAVVTDTTQYMPREVIEANGVHLVSLYVHWQGRQDREIDLPDFDGFYEHLRSGADLPTTSQPSIGDFLEVYEPLLERGDDIVSIHLSGAISGTVRAAEQARDQLAERGIERARIEVVDAATVCAGTGQPVIAAAHAARRGASAAEASAAARRCREGVKIIFAVDTLEFLRRGGRIGAASAYLGTALKIKPILTLEEEVRPIGKVRTWSRAFEHLVGHLEERRAEGCDAWCIQHIQAHDQAEKMLERGRTLFGVEPEFVSEIGPVIGTHAGPGLLGVSAIRRSLLEAR